MSSQPGARRVAPRALSAGMTDALLDAFACVSDLTQPRADALVDEAEDDLNDRDLRAHSRFYALEPAYPSLGSEDAQGNYHPVLTEWHEAQFIASVGHVRSNAPFLRVVHRTVRSNATPRAPLAHELHFVCRPLELDLAERGIWGLLRNLGPRSNLDPTRKTTMNVINILRLLSDATLVQPWDDAPFRCHRGLLTLLAQCSTPAWWWYHDAGVQQQMNAGTGANPLNLNWICNLIEVWRARCRESDPLTPQLVSFEGFSLGAMQASVLAPCVHAWYVRSKRTPPSMRLVSLCGMRVGDAALVNYVAQHMPAWNVLSQHDPVSRMPSPRGDFRHVAPIILGLVHDDNAKHRLDLELSPSAAYVDYLSNVGLRLFYTADDPELRAALHTPTPSMFEIVVGFMRNKFGNGPSDDFKRYHLSAEDVLPRLVLSYAQAVLNVAPTAYFGDVDAARICAYFDASNYSKKYGICVPYACKFTERDFKYRCVATLFRVNH